MGLSGLNLYKNYNLSLSDIHKQKYAAELASPSVATPTASERKRNQLIKYMSIALMAVLIIFLSIVIYLMTQPQVQKPAPKEQSVPDLLPTIPLEYTSVQLIEFAQPIDNNSTVLSVADAEVFSELLLSSTPTVNINSKVENLPAITDLTKIMEESKPVIKPVVKPLPPVLYSLHIDSLSGDENLLLKQMAVEKKISYNEQRAVVPLDSWAVYHPKVGTGVYINGLEVTLGGSFSTKEGAISYASNISTTDSFVVKEDKSFYIYSADICCMDMDKVRAFIDKSGIVDKVFKVSTKTGGK